ncbi:MarR family winged helix-turn-helix transcriptional regulator [Trichlorobacter lovleyi]|jgi:DNA-binding MarR family transcriptional regulator|uniref:Transcriptional regulator, MarR family n=1 Tax=Trichlorobacter lovleyi (strain ATCC BAA-1151 / DSM 17278 / SZ) TaxID=398767 RepID=B3E826_TRIL1|nr:MarR family transcriptional regulator [Trichlorobacter lovleyi]ACD96599.1 transcriptional regulator, MarR family [Trichlorobacter lovleyi SZ]
MSFIMTESLAFIVYRTAMKLRTEMLRRLKPFGVTPEQWLVLDCLAEQDGVSQRELAGRTFKDNPATTRILDKLMALGLIRRDDNNTDRRAFFIVITDKGRDLRDRILPIAEEMNEDAGRGISVENKTRLFALMNHLQKNMDGQ